MRWKPILDYPKYFVSSTGMVKSAKGGVSRILKPGTDGAGYAKVVLWRANYCKTVMVHKLVACAFVPGYRRGLQVDHINAAKKDNRACNLEWVTPKENTRRSISMGLVPRLRGEDSPGHKLTSATVLEIKNLLKQGVDQKTIAKIYNVNCSTISSINIGRTWAHTIC